MSMFDAPSGASAAEKKRDGCDNAFVLGCGALVLLLVVLLGVRLGDTISHFTGLNRVPAVLVALLAFLALAIAVAWTGVFLDRWLERRRRRQWETWRCPACSAAYHLEEKDAVRWHRRVYLASLKERHTNEDGVRLHCVACGRWSSFFLDGKADSFRPGPEVLLVGGDEFPCEPPPGSPPDSPPHP